jgi:hypothetical protein
MGSPPLIVPPGKMIGVSITPLASPDPLRGRCAGACGAETTPYASHDLISGFLRQSSVPTASAPTQDELVALEAQLRDTALAQHDIYLLGLNAAPAVEGPAGDLTPLALPGGLAGAGIYQLMRFPIARFNGIPLPLDSRIRFADPARWLQGAMESRLLTITVDGTNKFFSWDAHLPVGNKTHAYYHVNQKGMFNVFGEADHAALGGTALVRARQLRYLKIGGRIFLVVGVVVDAVQMGVAGYQSYEHGTVKPLLKQGVKTATGWAAAWAGAKLGIAAGAVAGVETGPGMVLTAIGGGLIGGVAGYFGGNWIADWIFEN